MSRSRVRQPIDWVHLPKGLEKSLNSINLWISGILDENVVLQKQDPNQLQSKSALLGKKKRLRDTFACENYIFSERKTRT
jgi:hypothetical protein